MPDSPAGYKELGRRRADQQVFWAGQRSFGRVLL